MANCKFFEHFLDLREAAGGGEFDRKAVIIEKACRFRAVRWTQQPTTSSD
jgi:hypothetical protein